MHKGFTIERFIIEEQKKYPQATGNLSSILYDIAFAAKLIENEVNKAGLGNVLGYAGLNNIQGERVKKLDQFAQKAIIRSVLHTGRLRGLISEEEETIIQIPSEFSQGPYLLAFDPLDGSSNIDVNVSIGTIFSIFKKEKKNKDEKTEEKDFFIQGRELIAAGYIVYGSSTMMVYSTGSGTHGFTLDPGIGEFLLSHENIKIPSECKYISANYSYFYEWEKNIQDIIHELIPPKGKSSFRYIGSLVADFHRNLLEGGVFFYPRTQSHPQGKLRLLYEAIPLAFLAEQAGGYASNGKMNILDILPTSIHQRTPLLIGNLEVIKKIEKIS